VTPSLGALCVLQAWEQRSPIPGGVAFDRLLQRLKLDYSPASLARIDTFLAAIRTAKKPARDAFLADPASRNLLDLLAFYVGEVVGRALHCTPEWLWAEPAAGAPGGARPFEESLLCNFPGAAARGSVFAPLVAICGRLFGTASEPGVADSAAGWLPPHLRASALALAAAPGFGYPLELQAAIARCAPQQRATLEIVPPTMPAQDPLAGFFAAAPQVLRSGRIAWAGVIEADETLAAPTANSGGVGAVVYDAGGRAPAMVLDEIAQVLSGLKAQPVADPALPEFSAWLAGATPRPFGLDVPDLVSPYPLKIATTWFARDHLPGGNLAHRCFPVVISDAYPGVVVFLPALLWPPVLLQAWQG
jgi:hypothetical protein